MGLLRDSDVEEIRERLAGMTNPVKLIHFTQELNLEYGRETLQLLEELTQISDKLTLETYNFQIDKERENRGNRGCSPRSRVSCSVSTFEIIECRGFGRSYS